MSGTTTQAIGTLINQALRIVGVVGVGETASASDVSDALGLCNMMLAEWQALRWLSYGLRDVSCISTGAQSYTIGAGGSFNTPRPDRIEAAFMRQLNAGVTQQVDFPLTIIPSMEDYSKIRLKTLSSFANAVFYQSDYPVGFLLFWPIPAANEYELHVIVKTPLDQFTGLTDQIFLPPAYQSALLWNLAVRLRPLYGFAPDPTISALAVSTLEGIRNSNAQVPTLRMPGGVPGASGGVYNPFSDSVN